MSVTDLETADAVRLLSMVDDDPAGWPRRRFLQAVGAGVIGGAGLAATDAFVGGRHGLPSLGQLRDAWAAPPVQPTEGILVSIVMFGGNDGLNTVVPFTDGNYYAQRGSLAVPAAQVLRLDDRVGLHPNLTYVKELYDSGQVAVVQGVGYANPDRSHFSSMAYWMSARTTLSQTSSGWIGRWLDGVSGFDAFRGATVGTSVPLHMIGVNRRASGIPDEGNAFGAGTEAWEQRLYRGVQAYAASDASRGPWHGAIAATERAQIDVARTVTPLMSNLPESEIVRKLVVAARLINANLGLRVVDVGWGDFDSHDDQPGMHPDRMAELNEGLRQFYATLSPAWRGQVTILTTSEFGRQAYANDSQGTDHGEASSLFVIGSNVAGGIYGNPPALAGLDRWDGVPFQIDYRSVYASVIDGWMGGGATDVLGANYDQLPLFASGPGGAGNVGPVPPSLHGDYVPLQPARIYDTRNGIGGRRFALGAGTTVNIDVLGQGGVPLTGVTSVAMNVTAVGSTAESYFTVWPAGDVRPTASSLNFKPGATVPNLVVTKVGGSGKVSVFNESGNVHCIADVVGYFRESQSDRLLPLAPFRLLDTRNAVGAPKAKLQAKGTIPLQVTGVAGSGVPANGVDAVVLNVTVDGPSSESYLTIWPNGEPLPEASSLNFVAGQTVPNLVIAKVGSGGIVNIFNAFGNVHVIADVVGCFTADALGRHRPAGPERLLDTRNNIFRNGALGNETMTMPVAGRAGVPAAATAAVLNMTVTGPTAQSFLTVWPSGQAMPTASSLNYTPGLTVANLVIAKLGPDGGISIANAFGQTHVIADVVGYFE